jgi:hypothetical protein
MEFKAVFCRLIVDIITYVKKYIMIFFIITFFTIVYPKINLLLDGLSYKMTKRIMKYFEKYVYDVCLIL